MLFFWFDSSVACIWRFSRSSLSHARCKSATHNICPPTSFPHTYVDKGTKSPPPPPPSFINSKAIINLLLSCFRRWISSPWRCLSVGLGLRSQAASLPLTICPCYQPVLFSGFLPSRPGREKCVGSFLHFLCASLFSLFQFSLFWLYFHFSFFLIHVSTLVLIPHFLSSFFVSFFAAEVNPNKCKCCINRVFEHS